MNLWQIARRSLSHYWRSNFSIALGVAAATAVLTGALIVGESMRKGLRDLTQERLGKIDTMLVSDGFFRTELANELSQNDSLSEYDQIVPAILFPNGTVEALPNPKFSKWIRASNVGVIGVTSGFWSLAKADGDSGVTEIKLSGNQVAINQALLDELSLEPTDEAVLTLRIPKPTQMPADSSLGKKRDLVESLVDLKLAAVVQPDQMGRFGMHPSQVDSPNIYVPIELLQDALSRGALKHKSDSNLANVLLLGTDTNSAQPAEKVAALKSQLRPTLEDHGLTISRASAGVGEGDESELTFDYWSLSSDRMVLSGAATKSIQAAFPEAIPVFTYLANDIRKPGEECGVPFSMVTSIDIGDSFPLLDVEGKRIPALADNEIVLNEWTAADLEIGIGDEIELAYYEPETTHGRQVESVAKFKLAAIAKLAQPVEPFVVRRRRGVRPAKYESADPPTLANDWWMTPEVPGVSDAETISNWDLPIDTQGKTRPEDDAYWTDFRTTPKGFVSLVAGQKLWGSRFGNVTSFRIPLEPVGEEVTGGVGNADEVDGANAGRDLEQLVTKLQDQLAADDNQLGFELVPIKANGLKASSGSTPFDVLFLALSMFVIASALILVSLLFRLGLAQRASEIGLLRAAGFDSKQVLKVWLREMSIVCLIGAVLGILLGIAYAAVMIHGLKTWWVGAISRPFIELYIGPISLIAGLVVGLLVCVLTIWWSLRRTRKLPVRGLLAGNVDAGGGNSKTAGAKSLLAAVVLLVLAVFLSIMAVGLSGDAKAGSFMGSGFCVLAAILLLVYRWLARGSDSSEANGLNTTRLSVMAARRNPLRSTLTIGLVAVASFLIVAVSSFRLAPTEQGTGGFDWIGQSSQAIYDDLNTAEGQNAALGTTFAEEVAIYSFRFKPGQDASCNNLYQSTQPRVLGVPQNFIERYDNENSTKFSFGGSMAKDEEEVANPFRLLLPQSTARPDGQAIPCLIDKNTANYSLKIFAPGTDFEVTYDSGETVTFHVVGFLSNTILQGSMIVSEEDFVRAFPYIGGYRYFLIDNPSLMKGLPNGYSGPTAAVPSIPEVLEDKLSDQGFDARSAPRVLSNFMAVQNTYLSTFQALGALGLLLGTFGLAAVQMRNVVERKKEFGLLRAVGFGRDTLGSMVLKENAFLLFVGLGVGILAALCATIPHFFAGSASMPWLQLAIMFGVIIIVGLLAGFLGSKLIHRLPLLDSLRA